MRLTEAGKFQEKNLWVLTVNENKQKKLPTENSQVGPMMKCEHFFVYASMAEIVEIAASHLSSYSFQIMSIKSGKIPKSRICCVAKSITGRT